MVLVARHHGRQITRSLDPTGGRPPANRNKNQSNRSILKSEGDSEYERRVKQKKTWQGDNQEWLGQNQLFRRPVGGKTDRRWTVWTDGLNGRSGPWIQSRDLANKRIRKLLMK